MMTPERYRHVMHAIGFNQNSMARFLRVDPRVSREWASGRRVIPFSVEALIEMMWAYNVTPMMIAKLIGEETPYDGEEESQT